MKNRKIRKTLRQIERLPLPAREKTIGSAALPPEPPRRLRALRFAGQAAAVAVVLTLLQTGCAAGDVFGERNARRPVG